MGFRELVVLLVVYGSLPVILFRPFLGICVFSWLAYMRPQDLAYGMGGHRLSQLVMLATIFGLLLHFLFPNSLGREKALKLHPTTLLMITLGFWHAVTAQTALVPALARAGGFDYLNFEKALFLALLTLGLVSSFLRFRIMLAIIAFSLGFLGLKYGLWGILSGGAQIVYGPGGFMSSRNAFALALNMAIPLLVAIGLTERVKLIRYSAYALVPFAALAIVFTFSRGGFLTLGVIGFLLVLRIGRPALAAFVLVSTLGAFFVLLPGSFRDQYLGRVNTVSDYQEDQSAMGRVREWKMALRIAADYPIFGIGPNNIRVVYPEYQIEDPDSLGPTRGFAGEAYLVSHNSFLQILVDSGLPALALLLVLTLFSLWRLQLLQDARSPSVVRTWARALQLSVAAWMLQSMLINMAYCDLIYHLFALTACLEVLARAEKAKAPVLTVVARHEHRWWKSESAARGRRRSVPTRLTAARSC